MKDSPHTVTIYYNTVPAFSSLLVAHIYSYLFNDFLITSTNIVEQWTRLFFFLCS